MGLQLRFCLQLTTDSGDCISTKSAIRYTAKNRVGGYVFSSMKSFLSDLWFQVPARAARPGNPGTICECVAGAARNEIVAAFAGYGFRRARWRDTLADAIDAAACEKVRALLIACREA